MGICMFGEAIKLLTLQDIHLFQTFFFVVGPLPPAVFSKMDEERKRPEISSGCAKLVRGHVVFRLVHHIHRRKIRQAHYSIAIAP